MKTNNMTPDDTLHKTWEFKGIEINPLSYGRRANIRSLIMGYPPSPTMFAAAIFGATCEIKTLTKGLRDPDWFTEQVTEWMEKIKLTTDDDAELGRIFRELLDNTEANRAVPITDPSMMADPVGNG